MIKSKHKFIEWSNDYINAFVLDENAGEFYNMLLTNELDRALELACLILDKNGLSTKTNWPENVHNKFQLINILKVIE